VLALYVMTYTAGRGWIEALRIDDVQLDDVFGLRLNVWTSIVLFVAAAAFFVWSARRRPGRESVVRRTPATPAGAATDPAPGDEPEPDRSTTSRKPRTGGTGPG
jgi:hypothetical protein